MNIKVSSLIGQSLLFEQKSAGKIGAVLFSAETGKMSGIQTATGSFYPAERIFFENGEAMLNSLEKTADDGEDWIGFHVVSADRKQEYGEVQDVEFVPQTAVIANIICKDKLLGMLPVSHRIFPYERILDVKNKTVVVDDDAADREEGELIPAM